MINDTSNSVKIAGTDSKESLQKKHKIGRPKGTGEKFFEYSQFVNWYSLPEHLRDPRTQRDFAKEYRVNEHTLVEWKNSENFHNDCVSATREWAQDKYPNVMYALYRKAVKDGSAQEVKLWLKAVMGIDLDSPSKTTNAVINYDNLTDGQLNELIKQEMKTIRALQAYKIENIE